MPKTILYDESTIEIYVRLPGDRAARVRARLKLKEALNKAFSAFEADARLHLPIGSRVEICRRNGRDTLKSRIRGHI
jgi:hypothetical protein